MDSRQLPERRVYVLTHVVEHLKAAGAYGGLFTMLEERGFLAEQATDLEGFQQGSRDLESHVLPVTIKQADWQRFLRYLLVTLNFRGLAEALAEEEILRALVQHGRGTLAAHIATQLSDPQARARARAVILGVAATPGANGTNNEELQRIVEDLDDVPKPTDDATAGAWCETLRIITRHLGPTLRDHWPGWIARLASRWEALAAGTWQAVAESWIDRDLSPASGLWEALAAITRKEVLAFLPRRLVASPEHDGTFLEHPLPPPFHRDEELLWHTRLAILGRSTHDQLTAEAAWAQLAEMPVAWSRPLVEAGRELWPQLGAQRIETLAATIGDPTVRVGLRVIVQEKQSSNDLAESTLRDLDAIPEASDRLHWSLRLLATQPESSPKRRQVRAVLRYLDKIRYGVAAADLARFLDLVARSLPSELRRQVANVIWSSGSSSEMLRTLAATAQTRALLDHLLEHAEKYAAAVSIDPSEGFPLRCELMIRITSRLCGEWGDLSSLEHAAERLLPDEEDQLRLAVVDALLAAHDPQRAQKRSFPALARRVCDGIRSRRLKLLTRLRTTSDEATLKDLLAPAALYQAVATTAVADDERLALTPLLEPPTDPEALTRNYLSRVRDGDRRIQGLIDLARHTLAFQRRVYGRQRDAMTALQPLAQAVGGASSDEVLATLTPELVEVAGEVSIGRAVAEIQEAILQVLRLDTVDRSLRIETLETIITRIGAVLLGEGKEEKKEHPPPRRCRAAVRLFHWLAQLPSRRELDTDGARNTWAELLPIVVAAPDLLPPLCLGYLRHPL